LVTTTIEQLRELREDRSVRQLADEVGTSAEMIRRWLRGEAQPRADRAETINQLFIELKSKGKVSEANPFTGGK
jgi:transcriptional regulator with XRE-family HTH domain